MGIQKDNIFCSLCGNYHNFLLFNLVHLIFCLFRILLFFKFGLTDNIDLEIFKKRIENFRFFFQIMARKRLPKLLTKLKYIFADNVYLFKADCF